MIGAFSVPSATFAAPNSLRPDPEKLRGICYTVVSQIKDNDPKSPFQYMFEKRIYEAAGATYEEPDDVIAHKISKLFAENEQALICEGSDFDVTEGNILKYAISGRTFAFINKAIDEWHVNLNVVDKIDNTTVLDYVERQIGRMKGTIAENTLRNYYIKLRKAGARHAREL